MVGVGEDAQASVRRRVGFDVFIIEFHQFVAFLDFLAVFDEDFEALAIEIDRVDADVQEVFNAVGGGHADGMFRFEDEGNRTVFRRIDDAVFRIDEESVTGHLAGKGFIRSFRDRMERREGRVEVAFFGVCFGRSGCFFFRFFCRSCFWNGFDGAVLRIGRQVVFKIGLDDGDLGTVNDLDAGTAFDDADGAGSFQGCVIYQAGIGNGAAQTCGAGVDRGDVLAAAEGLGDRLADGIAGSLAVSAAFTGSIAGLDVGFCIELRFRIIVFTTRRLQVEALDEEGEDEVIEEEVDDADGDDVHPARLGFPLEDTEDEEVQ
mgnify:CR=1 FL=1